MGFSRASLPVGLRIGGLAFAAIALVIGIGVSPLSPVVIGDDRVDVSFGEMLLRALIVIPIGTVLVEELIFRGVLHRLLRSELAALPAALVGSVLFGAWHLVPVWTGYDDVGGARRRAHLRRSSGRSRRRSWRVSDSCGSVNAPTTSLRRSSPTPQPTLRRSLSCGSQTLVQGSRK